MKPGLPVRIAAKLPLSYWFWISMVFFGQGICSIFAVKILKIPPREVVVPILVLFLGGLCTLLFYAFSDSGERRKLQGIVPLLFYATFITLMSNRSFSGVKLGFDASIFHPVEFFTLGLFLGGYWYEVIGRKGFPAFALRVILTGAVFACADEIHQSFITGRDADVFDVLLDLAGILISIAMIAAIRHSIYPWITSNRKP